MAATGWIAVGMPAGRRGSLARLSVQISLCFAASLPLLVPFGASRNIDMQGIVLLLAGGFAWLALVLGTGWYHNIGTLSLVALALFAASCLGALLFTPHFGYNALGSPYIRLGSFGLLACSGLGLLVKNVNRTRLASGLYVYTSLIVVISVVYSLLDAHSLYRFGGVFAQADIMACLIGCCLLLGWQFLELSRLSGRLAIAWQVVLFGLLITTETRAVLLLIVGLSLWWLRGHWQLHFRYIALIAALSLVVLVGIGHFAPDNRLANASYAKESVSYRLNLDAAGLHAAWQRPVLGYGPGNLADALACPTLQAAALQKTCHDDYFFNSSHVIYLDRVLAIGWLGGLAYGLIVILGVVRGNWKQFDGLQAMTILIAGYYFTNVTSIVLELLFWVVLLQNLAYSSQHREKR